MPADRSALSNRFHAPALLLLLTVLCLNAQAQKVPGLSFNVLSHDRDSFGIVEIRKTGFQFISPLLDCFSTTAPSLRTLASIETELQDYILTVKQAGIAQEISVYYRDLSNGPWLGIDEERNYAPASLLKLPVLIAALKYAQNFPDFLDRAVYYPGPGDKFKEMIIGGDMIVPGKTYRIRELLEHMIIFSDNEAKNLVSQNLPQKFYIDVFFDLGIDLNKNTDPDNFMTVKEYAGFFRILYNASYLNRDMSEFALQLLTHTAFNQGIVAGLPDNIEVAHKFGERYYPQRNIKQLHDCGIVYLKNHPYLVCVMTLGHDYTELETVISDISLIIYRVLKNNS